MNAEIKTQVENLVAGRTSLELVELWEMTESMDISNEAIVTRSWIEAELERRHPEAVAAWTDSADWRNSPRAYIENA